MFRAGDRAKRLCLMLPTRALPRALRVPVRQRALRRMELERARRASLLIVGHPKSGNTWLRTLLSRLYQVRHRLPSDFVVKTDELHLRDPRIPRILATNAYYSYEGIVGEVLDAAAPRGELHRKPLVLLARHPCDVAVSWYFQFTRRQSTAKRELINHFLDNPVDPCQVSMWEFVRNSDIGVPFLIDYMNTWERNVAELPRSLVVRYEDLHADAGTWLRRVSDLMGAGFGHTAIRDAAQFASFDNLRRLEAAGFFRTGGLHLRDAGDPESFKLRRGKVGGYRDYLSPEQVAELDDLVSQRLSPRFGYSAANEPSMRSSQRLA